MVKYDHITVSEEEKENDTSTSLFVTLLILKLLLECLRHPIGFMVGMVILLSITGFVVFVVRLISLAIG